MKQLPDVKHVDIAEVTVSCMTACACLQAVGKLHTLWIAFAKFYERHGDIENARVIFDKATQVQCLLLPCF